MTRHDDRISIRDMLEHSREAVNMLQTTSREAFNKDRMLQLALTRLVEIVGEAATRVSLETQQLQSEVPWPQIIGMRNRLVHGYDVIDLDLLWDTVTVDLRCLIDDIEKTLED